MNSKIFLIAAVLAVLSFAEAASPIFLENGSKICTLNNVGSIPSGSVKYPVYQKVCRQVMPMVGDQVEDDQDDIRRSSGERNDEEVDQVRRAILNPQKRSQ